MFRVAIDPDGFFRALGPDPGLGGPTLVVALMGFPLALKHLAYMVLSTSGEGAALVAAGTWLVAPFFLWVLVTVLFQVTTRLVGGTGGFTTTLRYVGWGFFPAVVSGLLNCAVALHLLSSAGVEGAYGSIKGAVESGALYRAVDGPLVDAAFFLWAGFLWVFAVEHARSVSRQDAAVTAGVPVVVAVTAVVVTG